MNPASFRGIRRSTRVRHTAQLVRAARLLLALLIGVGNLLAVQPTPRAVAAPPDDCKPYALQCSTPVALPFALTFDGSEGGLPDADGDETGFDSIQPNTAATHFGDVPANRNVVGGQLVITTTKGIQFKTATSAGTNPGNTQDNALGVAVEPAGQVTRIETVLDNPPNGSNTSEQAGIWFGRDQDNYVKAVLVSSGTSNSQYRFQLLRELDGVSDDNIEFTFRAPSTSVTLGGAKVGLVLTVNATTQQVSAAYKIGNGAETSIGSWNTGPTTPTLSVLWSSLFNGIDHDANAATDPVSFAGVFATHRNRATTASPPSLVYKFDSFAISETEPPPATPAGLAADAGNGQVVLDWNDVSGSGVGYRVYRSTVITSTGSLVSGTTPLASSAFTDTGLTNGTFYYYRVLAENSSGQSALSAQVSALPDTTSAPTQALPLQINFQSETALVPSSYTRDFGQPFANVRGYGWVVPGTNTPRSLIGNGRDRNKMTDQRIDTLLHMQGNNVTPPFNGVALPGAWEVKLPNGTYSVTVSVGDPDASTLASDVPTHTINVEGINAINKFRPANVGASTGEFSSTTVTVEVNDGRLTVDAIGGHNTKINYLIIDEVVADTTPPAAPTGLTAQAGNGEVVLDWNDNGEADLAGYRVLRSTDASSGFAPIGSLLTNSIYTDTSAVNAETYYYQVRAVDEAGNLSPASTVVNATPSAPTPSPTTATPTDEPTPSPTTATPTDEPTPSPTTATPTDEPTPSPTTATPADTTAPAAPTGLVATAGNGEVLLNWNDNNEADLERYDVHRATSASGPFTKIGSVAATSSAVRDNTVVNGET
jgi:fibronectin type 3 domain-containing protein